MNYAFSYSPSPILVAQRTPERCVTPLGLIAQSQAQHAAPRRQGPVCPVATLRAGFREGSQRWFSPSPADGESSRFAVSDQPVGHICCLRRSRVQAGRLIADALCVGTENERTTGAAYRLHTPVLTTRHSEMSPGLATDCASVASDLGSGVDTDNRCPRPHLNCPTAQIAGGVGQHGGAPLMHTSSHEREGAEIIRREEASMGVRGARMYLTETVMDEAEEADDAVMALVREIARSTADGRITEDELVSIKVAAGRATREVRDVVQAAETAAISQRIADNVLRGGVAESTRLRARDAGLIVPDFQIDMPQDAA